MLQNKRHRNIASNWDCQINTPYIYYEVSGIFFLRWEMQVVFPGRSVTVSCNCQSEKGGREEGGQACLHRCRAYRSEPSCLHVTVPFFLSNSLYVCIWTKPVWNCAAALGAMSCMLALEPSLHAAVPLCLEQNWYIHTKTKQRRSC